MQPRQRSLLTGPQCGVRQRLVSQCESQQRGVRSRDTEDDGPGSLAQFLSSQVQRGSGCGERACDQHRLGLCNWNLLRMVSMSWVSLPTYRGHLSSVLSSTVPGITVKGTSPGWGCPWLFRSNFNAALAAIGLGMVHKRQ